MIATIIILTALNGSPDVEKLVKAIEGAENTPWHFPGGGLQWTKVAWYEETNYDYTYANYRGISRQLAAQRITKFVRRLHALEIPATPYLLGSMWNHGFNGALRMRRQKQHDDFGQRVENLYLDQSP